MGPFRKALRCPEPRPHPSRTPPRPPSLLLVLALGPFNHRLASLCRIVFGFVFLLSGLALGEAILLLQAGAGRSCLRRWEATRGGRRGEGGCGPGSGVLRGGGVTAAAAQVRTDEDESCSSSPGVPGLRRGDSHARHTARREVGSADLSCKGPDGGYFRLSEAAADDMAAFQ